MADEIGATEISEYLSEHSDFDLEQHVYNTLRSKGIAAKHGGGYLDPLTDKYRQFDIRASKEWDTRMTIRMAIECKSLSPDFPLVVLRVPRPRDESFHDLMQGPGEIHGATHSGVTTRRCVHDSGPYRVGEPVGKSAMQIGFERGQPKPGQKRKLTGSDKDTFDRWSQALASAAYLFEEAISDHLARRTLLTFIMPILVVPDATLWAVNYSDIGARQGEPVRLDEVTFFVDRQYQVERAGTRFAGYVGHLHIFTKAGFEGWVANITNQSSSTFCSRVFEHAFRGH